MPFACIVYTLSSVTALHLLTAKAGTSTQGDTFWDGENFRSGGSSGGGIRSSSPQWRSGGGGGAGGTSSDYYHGQIGMEVSITSTPKMYAGGGGAGALDFLTFAHCARSSI